MRVGGLLSAYSEAKTCCSGWWLANSSNSRTTMTNFKKRTFTFRDAVPITLAAARVFPRLVRSFWKPRLSASLRERIMLAVISVNNCRYCSWVHTGLALTNDVDLDELDVLLGQNLEQKSDEREAVRRFTAAPFTIRAGNACCALQPRRATRDHDLHPQHLLRQFER